jgi:recombinational DNA repair protein RecT
MGDPALAAREHSNYMTARIAADGATAGCVVAILQASQMGLPVYEQLGYRTVVDYVGYVDPPAPEPAPA